MPHLRNWILRHADFNARDRIVSELGLLPVVATVLVNRGLRDTEDVRRFLEPKLSDMYDPSLMLDMDIAVERIQRAVMNREKVLVYGDYDVDGICAAVVVRDFLRLLHIDCDVYIPDRLTEGYDLNLAVVEQYAQSGHTLLITVDCGVRAAKEVERANELGIDVIITDHHEVDTTLPPAVAIVDPMRPNCPYPFKRLAGVGVAYKLVWALAKKLCGSAKVPDNFRDYLLDALPIVALGTICDVVPLLNENRVLVSFGLSRMTSSNNLGIRSILETSGLMSRLAKGKGELTARDIAFQIGPRINAAGRMGVAGVALELFSTTDTAGALKLADQLDTLNRKRQELEAQILLQACEKVESLSEVPNAIVLCGDDWHQGVLGIVATKLVNRYYRPTYLCAPEGDMIRGSARSVDGFDIVQSLASCSDILDRFGGHAGAAGFSVHKTKFGELAARLNDYAGAAFSANSRLLTPTVYIDAELPFDAINERLINDLQKLAPFGHDHEKPLFSATNVEVVGEQKLVGSDNQHIVLYLKNCNRAFRAIAFKQGEHIARLSNRVNVLYSPKVETFNGMTSIQLEIHAFRSVGE